MGLTPPDEEVRGDSETQMKNENRPLCVCVCVCVCVCLETIGETMHIHHIVCETVRVCVVCCHLALPVTSLEFH